MESTEKLVHLSDDTDWKAQQEIPEEEANKALIELGIETLNLKKIRNYRKIAKVLKSVGMLEYERGMLIYREQSLHASIIAITNLLLNDGNKDTKVAASLALKELVGAANKTSELNIKLEDLAHERAQKLPPDASLPPIMQQVAFIVNQKDYEQKETKEKRPATPLLKIDGPEIPLDP